MRAVSFFGDAGRTGGAAIPDWPGAGGAGGRMPDGGGGMAAEPAGGAGFKGMVGLPVSGGGLGGVTLLSGLVIGAPPGFGGGGVPESGRVATPDGAAGAGGGATGGRGAAGGVTEAGIGILDVSFFGTWPTAGGVDVPGTLILTVSLLIEGCSVFGGSVIRMVSFLVESSSCMFGWSAMIVRGGDVCISATHSCVNGVFGEIPVQEHFQRPGRMVLQDLSPATGGHCALNGTLFPRMNRTSLMELMKILKLQSRRFRISIPTLKSVVV